MSRRVHPLVCALNSVKICVQILSKAAWKDCNVSKAGLEQHQANMHTQDPTWDQNVMTESNGRSQVVVMFKGKNDSKPDLRESVFFKKAA